MATDSDTKFHHLKGANASNITEAIDRFASMAHAEMNRLAKVSDARWTINPVAFVSWFFNGW